MTHNIPTELQRYVQERIIPQYAGFDKAHQIDHAEKVIEESLKLALHYEVNYMPRPFIPSRLHLHSLLNQ